MARTELVVGFILALLWTSRLMAYLRGLPRIRDLTAPEWLNSPAPLPRLSVIVPARNEASAIERCLTSLLQLDYPDFEVIAVDDRSTDSTGAIMDRLAATDSRLKIIHVTDLPPGWMGKTHAMWQAAERATGEVLLFTDGDTIFRPDSLRRALHYMLSVQADHLVLYPTMLFNSPGEKMMVSFFHAMLSFIHRPWKVSDPKALDHVGVGAFNLIRRSAYQVLGTYKAMRMEVIDDLRLGRLVKVNGFKQDVALGPDLVSLHWASGAMGIVNNLSKNTFAALRFQWVFAVGAVLGIAFISLVPLIGLVFTGGFAKLGYLVALCAMAGLYVITRRLNAVSPGYFVLHPIAALLTMYLIARSAWLTTLRGVTWRGTSYPLKQFRKAAAKDWD